MATPTPMRDEFRINEEAVMDDTSDEKERLRAQRQQLKTGLGSLPDAQHSYEINIPEAPEEDEVMEPLNEDATDRDRRLEEMRKAQEEAELRRRSTVLQQGLPRPKSIDLFSPNTDDGIEKLVQKEMVSMIEYDNAKYPIGKTKKRRTVPHVQMIPDDVMKRARDAVELECHLAKSELSQLDAKQYGDLWQKLYDALVPRIDGEGKVNAIVPKSELSEKELIASFKYQLDQIKGVYEKKHKRAQKLEKKVKLLTAGFEKRANESVEQILKAESELASEQIQYLCFQRLAALEKAALVVRMSRLASQIDQEKKLELELQNKYEDLMQNNPTQ